MSKTTIIIPGEMEGWELWQGGRCVRSADDLGAFASASADAVIGLPAGHVNTFAVKLPPVEEALIPEMAFSQVERRGHAGHDSSDTVMDYRALQAEGEETLLSIDVLTGDFPESWCQPRAAGYTLAARLIERGDHVLFLFREQRRLVLAAVRAGRVSHVQVMNSGSELSPALAQEINLLVLSLQGEGVLNSVNELLLIGSFQGEEREAFEQACVMGVLEHPERKLRADAGEIQAGLLPSAVRDSRVRRKRRAKQWVIGVIAMCFYMVAAAWAVWYSGVKADTLAALRQEVSELAPAAEEVQLAASRWRQLEPAIAQEFYPLVQLSEVTRLMPPSGILIREFETRDRSVWIRGQARDAQVAFQFEEDLKQSQAFSAYGWDMPQPDVDKNNSVTFKIQGKWMYEETE